jgi:hypothetical protein
MPFTKEQQHEHYLKNKEIVKAKRRERYLKSKTPTQANPNSLVQPSLPEKNEVGTAQLTQEKIIREDERFITYARRL